MLLTLVNNKQTDTWTYLTPLVPASVDFSSGCKHSVPVHTWPRRRLHTSCRLRCVQLGYNTFKVMQTCHCYLS